jgi:hypothetical protein
MWQLIFIRHGESTANVLKNTFYGLHFFVRDAPLSTLGVSESIRLQKSLQKIVKREFFGQPYSIGSSNMIRAQETAYYMLALPTRKKITIYPHIGESGFTLDNISLEKTDQYDYFGKTNRDIINFIGLDFRDSENKSCWPSFVKWLQLNRDLFAKGSDGVFRGVIFSHSNFLNSVFPFEEGILPNNQGLITTLFPENESPSFTRLYL